MSASPSVAREQILASLRSVHETIIATGVDRALKRTDEVQHHGEDASRIIRSGIDWALNRLPVDRVKPEHIVSRFEFLNSVLDERLPSDEAVDTHPHIDWMIDRIHREES